MQEVVEGIRQILQEDERIEYYGALGQPVQRLRDLKKCFEQAEWCFGHRYLKVHQQIECSEGDVNDTIIEEGKLNLKNLSGTKLDWKQLEKFLCTGLKSEIEDFVFNYMSKIGEENLKSLIFRQYFLLYIQTFLNLLINNAGLQKQKQVKTQTTEKDIDKEGYVVVGVAQVGSESDWRNANTQSFKDTFTTENGYYLIFEDGQQKQENQVKAIRNFILQEVDYIILDP